MSLAARDRMILPWSVRPPVRTMSPTKPGPIMQFRLVYDGPLPSAGNKSKRAKEKHEIRKYFHPQLKALWGLHPGLIALHQADATAPLVNADTLAFIKAQNRRCGHEFVPLVCDYIKLVCTVDILFLRHEDPGALFAQGGDLDNRLKTLFDALKVPDGPEGVLPPEEDEKPFFVLLEDDKRIAGYTINTDRLLTTPVGRGTDVRLVIQVTTRAVATMWANIGLA
jgi:hypothetical protein